MAHYFETGVFGNNQPAWHNLGLVTDEKLTPENILEKAKLNWLVQKNPLYLEDGTLCPMAFVLQRDTDGKQLGVVGKTYLPYQNHELLSLAQALAGEGVEFETAMSLKEGQIVTLLAKLQPYNVLGDKFRPYMSLCNYHDGAGARNVYCTDVREVCWNTHSISIGSAKLEKRVWRKRHTPGALITDKQALDEARALLQLSEQQSKQIMAVANALVKVKMQPTEYEKLAALLYPLEETEDKPATDRQKLIVEEKRSMLYKAAQADDLANFRNTAWGALSAVTAVQSHVSNKVDTTKPEVVRRRQEDRFIEQISGGELEKKALEFLLALA